MKLTVGDVVVYAAYGVGRIVAREKRVIVGSDQEIVVLELAHGLTVTLPLERAIWRYGRRSTRRTCAGCNTRCAKLER